MTNRSNLVPIAIFLGCGYILHMSDCLKVDAKYSQNNVVFTCNISPYTGRQIWSIDSTEVSECGFTGCSENSSNPARYSFTNDLGSGNFTFKIDPLESKEVGSIVSCFDGTNVQNHTVATAGSSSQPNNGWCSDFTDKTCLPVIIVIVVIVLAITAIIFWYYNRHHMVTPEKDFYLLNVGKESIVVRWDTLQKPTEEKQYKLVCLKDGEEKEVFSALLNDAEKNFIPEIKVTGLEPSTPYTITLNCSVKSKESDDDLKTYVPLSVTTCGRGQTPNLKDFYLLNVGQTSIKVCWILPQSTKENSPEKYTLTTFLGEKTVSTKTFKKTMKESMKYTITGLKPLSSYKIKLARRSNKLTEDLEAKTYGQRDEQPEKDFFVIKVGTTSIRVKWKAYTDGESSKTYCLTYEGNGTKIEMNEVENGVFTKLTIKDLAQSTLYQLNLACSENKEESDHPEESDKSDKLKEYRTLDVKTNDASSDEFWATDVKNSSIKLHWHSCESQTMGKYILSYTSNGGKPTDEEHNKNDTEVNVINLKPSTWYELNLRCLDESENLLKVYRSLYKRTTSDTSEFWVTDVTNSSIKVQWNTFQNEGMEKYILSYTANDKETEEEHDKSVKEVTVTFLKPSTQYALGLRCLDKSKNILKIYNSIIEKTKDTFVKDDFSTSEVTDKSIKVRWKTCKSEPITKKYILSYFNVKTIVCDTIIDKGVTDYRERNVSELTPGVLYELNLRCFDESDTLLKVYKPLYVRTTALRQVL